MAAVVRWTMKWYLVVERDGESGKFIGTVPGLSIYVEAASKDDAMRASRSSYIPE